MKKIILILLSFMLVLSTVACTNNSNKSSATGQNENTSSNGTESGTSNSSTGDESNSNGSASTKTNEGSKKILIAYFSQTGTTKKAAERIQELTKGDIFEIKTATPYPEDYQKLADATKKERDENARPKLAGKVENMDDYDVIFVGYPIWWHTAPMAIDTFLESYNLSGKTIVPFCTSSSSDIKESMGAINTLGAKANILEGLTANNLNDIEPWLKKIDIIK
jgi:flavodoxin